MKTILVMTDLSSGSANAVQYAAHLALKVKADLYLFHVLTFQPQNPNATLDQASLDSRRETASADLFKTKLELEKIAENNFHVHTILEHGNLEEHLENFCQRKAPFMVVMGVGKNKEQSLQFGNNTLKAIQHLEYPILVVPDHAHFHGIKKILLAYDLEDFTKTLPVEHLKEIKDSFQSTFDLLHVNTKKSIETKANFELASVKSLLYDLQPQFYFRNAATVEEGINNHLEENKIDLIIMLPKHHVFFSFHKSHTRQMALNPKIPLMAIHE